MPRSRQSGAALAARAGSCSPGAPRAGVALSLLASCLLVGSSEAQLSQAPTWVRSAPDTQALSVSTFGTGAGVNAFVCRYADPATGRWSVGGRPFFDSAGCSVVLSDGTATGSTAISIATTVPADGLARSPLHAWLAGSAILPPGTAYVYANATAPPAAPRLSAVCRASHPTAATGPFAGEVTANGLECAFGFGSAVASNTVFDVLVAMSPNATAADWATPGLSPLVASPSNTASTSLTPSITPSVSPSPTPSPAGAPPGQVMLLNLTLAGSSAVFTAMQAGLESNRLDQIFACVAEIYSNVTGALTARIAGKMDARQGTPPYIWNFCAVALNERETNIGGTTAGGGLTGGSFNVFTVIRASPWLLWCLPGAAANLAPYGATEVTIAGPNTPEGLPVRPCRAWRISPTDTAGPHAGTVGYALGAGPSNPVLTCNFGWGGGVVHATAYDVLWLLPSTLNAVQAAGAATTCAVNGVPSPSQSPSPTNSPPPPSPSTSPAARGVATWINVTVGAGVGWSPTNFVTAGAESDGAQLRVCRASFPSVANNGTTVDTVGGKWIIGWNFCNVLLGEAESNDASFEVLLRSPFMAWVSPGSGPVGVVNVSAGTVAVAGGGPPLSAVVCRAWHPSGTGPHPGYYTPGAPQCVYSWGGGIIRAAPFEILVHLPAPYTVADYNSTGPPRPTALPSPSASPLPAGTIAWVAPPADRSQATGGFLAGVVPDAGGNLSVCRGVIVTGAPVYPLAGDMAAGFWTAAAPDACAVPALASGFLARSFEILRPAPNFGWVDSSVPLGGPGLPLGSVAVVAGVSNDGTVATVCRARHPITGAGPFGGYTDSVAYDGVGDGQGLLCFFYSGAPPSTATREIAESVEFDILYVLAPASATPTATATASPRTRTATASATATASFNASKAGPGLGSGAAAGGGGAAPGLSPAAAGGVAGGVLALLAAAGFFARGRRRSGRAALTAATDGGPVPGIRGGKDAGEFAPAPIQRRPSKMGVRGSGPTPLVVAPPAANPFGAGASLAPRLVFSPTQHKQL